MQVTTLEGKRENDRLLIKEYGTAHKYGKQQIMLNKYQPKACT